MISERARRTGAYLALAMITGFFALVVSSVVSGLILVGIAWTSGVSLKDGAALMEAMKGLADPARPLGLVLGLLPASLAFLWAGLLMSRRVKRQTGVDLLPMGRPRWLDLLLVPLGMVAWSTALGAGISLLGFGDAGTIAELRDALARQPLATRVLLLPATALLPGLAEELFFRGFVLGAGEALVDRRTAFWVSSILFGLVHVDPVHATVATGIGMFLGYARLATGTLWTTVLAHAVNNALATLGAEVSEGPSAHLAGLLAGGVAVGLWMCVLLGRRPISR